MSLFPSEYRRKHPITIPSGSIDSNLTNYTMLIFRSMLHNEIFNPTGSYRSQSDGKDIAFSSDIDGTGRLPCDVIRWSYDSSSGAADAQILAAVKVPSLTTTSNRSLYIWYSPTTSNAEYDITGTYGRYNAYDSNHRGFWPLTDDFNDRTINQYNLTGVATGVYSPPTAGTGLGPSGMIPSTTFDGIAQGAQLSVTGIITGPPLTFLSWFQCVNTTLTPNKNLITIANVADVSVDNYYMLQQIGGGSNSGITRAAFSKDGTFGLPFDAAAGNSANLWNQHSANHFSSSARARRNDTTGTILSFAVTPTGLDRISLGANGFGGNYANGSLALASVHNVERASGWINAYYDNVKVPNIFGAFGAPENGPGQLPSITLNFSLVNVDVLSTGSAAQRRPRFIVSTLGDITWS